MIVEFLPEKSITSANRAATLWLPSPYLNANMIYIDSGATRQIHSAFLTKKGRTMPWDIMLEMNDTPIDYVQ